MGAPGEQVQWDPSLGLYCFESSLVGRGSWMNLYLFKWWQRKESSRYGDFGVGSNLLGSNLGWPKTSNSLVPENIQKTLLFFSWNRHLSVLTRIIGFTLKYFWTASPSTCFNYWSRKNNTIHTLQKSLGQNTRVTPHCRRRMSAQECRYNLKPTLLPEITHFKLIL